MTDKTKDDDFPSAATFKMARETCTGDIRDALLNVLKDPRWKPWPKMSETEQRLIIYNLTQLAEGVVRRTATIVAAEGRRCCRASVNKFAIGDSIKLDLEVSKFDPERHALADSSSVLIVMDGIEAYRGERAPAKAAKDQPALFDPKTGEIEEGPPAPAKPNGPDNQPTA